VCHCAIPADAAIGNGPRHDVRNKIRVKEHSMHKEQIRTLQQLQRRHVTYLAREPYCDL